MYEIARRLQAGRPVVATLLASEWNCSPKSVTRTLQHMQAEGLPIEYDRRRRQWVCTRPIHEIPAGLVSAEDRRALLFALRATGSLDGLPVGPAVRRLYQKLLDTLPPERATAFSQAMEHVHFVGPRPPEVRAAVWESVLLSLEASTTMHIHYTDGGHGSNTHRDVDPYALIMRDRRWILVARCHWAKDIRTFSLHRITQVETGDDEFNIDQAAVQRYLSAGFGGYPSTGEPVLVRLRIPVDAPLYVKDKCWSEVERRTTSHNGDTEITFQTSAVWAVERDILAEGGGVEIIAPANARQHIRDAAMRMTERHTERT